MIKNYLNLLPLACAFVAGSISSQEAGSSESVALAVPAPLTSTETTTTHGQLYAAIERGDLEQVKIYLSLYPAAVHASIEGKRPLHVAAETGTVPIAEELINHGAPLLTLDTNWNTPLHSAARCNHPRMVQHLVHRGARKNFANQLGRTPLYEAARMGHASVVRSLVENGVKPFYNNARRHLPINAAAIEGHPAIIALLASKDIRCIEERDYAGQTPLMRAIAAGHLECVKLLLALGAKTTETTLMIALTSNLRSSTVDDKVKYDEMKKFLLRYGVPFGMRGQAELTHHPDVFQAIQERIDALCACLDKLLSPFDLQREVISFFSPVDGTPGHGGKRQRESHQAITGSDTEPEKKRRKKKYAPSVPAE